MRLVYVIRKLLWDTILARGRALHPWMFMRSVRSNADEEKASEPSRARQNRGGGNGI